MTEEGRGGREHHAAQTLKEAFGLSVQRLIPLTGGYLHRVWRVETPQGDFCAKLYSGDTWSTRRVEPTLAVQVAVWQDGHPVPRVHTTRDDDWLAPVEQGCLALFSLASGDQRDGTALRPDGAASCGAVLGLLHRTLSRLPTAHKEPFIPEPQVVQSRCQALLAAAEQGTEHKELDELAREAAQFRLKALADLGLNPSVYGLLVHQVIHGDYYPANLLFDEDEKVTAVLDWDFAGPHWRELEVGRALVESSLQPGGQMDWERAEAFLQAYTAVQVLTEGQRLHMFRAWFNYLLHSLYPLPLGYSDPGALPRAWATLARRRHRMLVLLKRHLDDLERWAQSWNQ